MVGRFHAVAFVLLAAHSPAASFCVSRGQAALPTPPCAATQAALLRAVVSKLPPGTYVTPDQLRSLCGLWAYELCGLPLKQLSGSWDLAISELFPPNSVDAVPLPPAPPQPPRKGRSRRQRQRRRDRPPPAGAVVVPDTALWQDPRPPPELSTVCLGPLIEGATTWLTNDPSECERLLEEHGFAQATHLGLDLEWTPTMVRGQHSQLAMLQIATRQHCILLRVGQMAQRAADRDHPMHLPLPPPPLPPILASLLGSPTPLKVGRGIKDDAKLIRRQLGVEVTGTVELPGRLSLKDLAKSATRLEQPDSAKWMTNWDARHLPTDVLKYAAFDAIAAYEIHLRAPELPKQQPRGRPKAGQFPRPPRQARGSEPQQQKGRSQVKSSTSSNEAELEGRGLSNRATRREQLAELRGDAPPSDNEGQSQP